jgi:hypothetical protein
MTLTAAPSSQVKTLRFMSSSFLLLMRKGTLKSAEFASQPSTQRRIRDFL